jgi:peptidoglycan/xylan/chitin deacetylase (PgdA/CDA1 family)
LIICFLVSPALAVPARAGDCNSVDALSWLLGYWESRDEKSVTSEHWRKVGENTIEVTGLSLALPDFNVTFLESIVVAPLSGAVYFNAKVPHNKYPVAFELTACTTQLAVFENTDHDFPNKITYNLASKGQLRVDVSGNDGNGFSIHLAEKALNRQIALTFDDAPRSDRAYFNGDERTRLLIENLQKANSPPVIFYTTTRGIEFANGDARMRFYQNAGHFIGNHTHTHQRIDSLGVDAYIEDIETAHDLLLEYENFVPLFRYPFLDEGRDIESRDRLRLTLAELGYANGYVTIDNYDFHMDSLLQKAKKQGRAINHGNLRRAYVESLMETVRFFDDMAEQHLEHVPPHVLLLHENDMAAMFIGDLIRALRMEGWTIIDAREAYKDPIAKMIPDTLFNNQGRVAAIARTNGAEPRQLVQRAEDTGFLDIYFEEQNAFGEPLDTSPDQDP